MVSTKKIRGRVYTCEKVNVKEGFALLGRFTKIIAPFASLLDSASEESEFFKTLESALIKIDWSENIDLMSDLVELCLNDQKIKVGFETDVASMGEAIEIVLWVVEVQFGDFFAESRDLFRKIAVMVG